jgi:hypothetical protein
LDAGPFLASKVAGWSRAKRLRIARRISMKSRILLSFLFTMLLMLANGCGSVANCPVCGTTKNDGYAIIDIMPVPEHNPTGAPGGPFNSFDISWVDPLNHLDYVSDRIGLDVAVFDTINDLAVNAITGANGVAGGGLLASGCFGTDLIPPTVSVLGNFTRFGCRTMNFHIPAFGANQLFGGFTGAQCCAGRANGVNPLSCPCGIVVTADGHTMFVGNASSTVVVFDLTTNPPVVIANIPTGQSPDFDGPNGTSPCVASAQGRALSDPTCGDMRADEMAYDETDHILLVTNGDPGLPFVTVIDMSGVVAPTGEDPVRDHCLPVDPSAPYGPPLGNPSGTLNVPTCILGQIYYDGAPQNNMTVTVDDVGQNADAGFVCPDPSVPATLSGITLQSGVSGHNLGMDGADVACHHGPIIATSQGGYCDQVNPASNCAGAVSLAGLGGSAFNPNTGKFLVSNGSASPTDLTIGTIDVIDPKGANGPVVVGTFPTPNCMPTSIVQGPGNNFLVGCADHDGVAFPPNEYVIDGTSGAILATINNVGGVDETWYNPGDHRYYLAARDMPNGPVLGVIDAKTNQWLQNVATNTNSHSVAVDPSNNHVFVPLQSGPICTTQSQNGCIGVYAQQ